MSKGKKWEEWEEKYLIENYENKTKQEICDFLNKTYPSICIKAMRLGLVRNKKRWTKHEIQKLEEYNILGLTNLAESFKDRSVMAVKSQLCIKGIRKNKVYRNGKYNKYSFNEDYFSNLNINNSYIAGWIASDGHLSNCRSLSWHLSRKDKGVLDFFKKELEYTGPIFDEIQKDKEYCVLSICGAYKIQNDLFKYWNIPVGRKTSILKPPSYKELSEDMIFSYICGIISGDGSIGYYKAKNNSKQLTLTIAGNEYILEWISNEFSKILNGTKRKVHKKENTKGCSIEYRCLQALTIIEKIKKIPISFWLDRKFNIPQLNNRVATFYDKN